MTRFYLTLSASFLCLLTALMVIIHAQPYDDHGLRALLMPDNCEMPCFMGIRPGVTTADEAVRLLQASGWVAEIDTGRLPNTLKWTWNGLQPAFIDGKIDGYLEIPDRTVYTMSLELTVPVAEIWWALEQPTLVLSETAPAPLDKGKELYFFWYPQQGMYLQTATQLCAAPLMALIKGNLMYFASVETTKTTMSNVKTYRFFHEIPLSRFNSRRVC